MLTMLLNDFLSISRLEEGKVELSLEKVNFQAFCQEVMDEMNITLKKGQKLITHHEDADLVIEIDKKSLSNMVSISTLFLIFKKCRCRLSCCSVCVY